MSVVYITKLWGAAEGVREGKCIALYVYVRQCRWAKIEN